MKAEWIKGVPFIDHHHHQWTAILNEHFWDGPFNGIEIGTKAGDLTVTMLRDIPNLVKVWTIDPWRHFDASEFEAANEQAYHDEQMRIALHRLAQYGERVETCRMTSDEFFENRKDLKVDFVHIDGHHTYEQAKRDIQNAKKIVKQGGIIGGHDYGLVERVNQAVEEEFKDHPFHVGGDFVWVAYV
jgi:predicted O-methyltransferase YrrM